jgi:hypothetical protein
VNAVIDGQIDIAISAARSPTGGCASSSSRMSWWRSCPPGTASRKRDYLEPADFREEVQLSYSAVTEKGFEDERFFRPARAMPKRWLAPAMWR